jgi:hypothetical protein
MVTNCTFSGNSAFNGGGMCNSSGSPIVTNCTFRGNLAEGFGGGMYNSGSNPVITNCTFERNYGCTLGWGEGSGGGVCNFLGSPTINNCTFSENSVNDWYTSEGLGGGMFSHNATVTNCTFSGNSANDGGGMYIMENGTVTNCTFSGNLAYAYEELAGGYVFSGGGGMYIYHGTVTNCTFSGNLANYGGGMYNMYGTVANCMFSGNLAYAYIEERIGLGPDACGGGMFSDAGIIVNCIFSGNLADANGGGICTYGGGPYHFPSIINCTLWGDTAKTDGNEIAFYNSSTIDVNYCDVQGWQSNVYVEPGCTLNWGPGNIDDDPCFIKPGHWGDVNDPNIVVAPDDPNAIWVEGNYRLLPGSPCIDAGNNTAVPLGVVTDLDGRPRFMDDPWTPDTGNGTPPIVDMGAYECPAPAIYKVDDINAGDCVEPGDEINYRIDYNYPAGPNWPDINDVNIIDELPDEVEFISSEPGPNEIIDSNIIWHIGTLSPGESGFVTLKVKVKGSAVPCWGIRNNCKLRSGEQILNSSCEYTAVCGKEIIVVEDFDSYVDDADMREAWKDWRANDTCSEVFLERVIARDGYSMKYLYWNYTWPPYYSEANATMTALGMDPNWLGTGSETLSLWFYGQSGNGTGGQMYIKLTDSGTPVRTAKVFYDGDMNDIKQNVWHEWNIVLQDFVTATPSFNLSKVAEITIGFGDETPATRDGIVYFDDIQLCVPRCVLSERSADFAEVDYAPPGNPDGDCVIDYREIEIMAYNWLMPPPADANVDVHSDGTIDLKDFALVAKKWLEEEMWP